MTTKLAFDHTHVTDPNHRFLNRLESLGFTLDERRTEHPGKHFCRFIAFATSAKTSPNYLEFVRVGRGGKPVTKTGLSFGYGGKLEEFFAKIKRARSFKTEFEHRNYDWKTNAKDRLPGWNFVSFKNLRLPDLYPWVTEYERRPGSPPRNSRPVPRHANGVQRILGLELGVNARGREFLDALLGPPVRDGYRLRDGTQIHLRPQSRTELTAIVLQAKSVSAMAKKYKLKVGDLYGHPAIRIKNPGRGWDLVIV